MTNRTLRGLVATGAVAACLGLLGLGQVTTATAAPHAAATAHTAVTAHTAGLPRVEPFAVPMPMTRLPKVTPAAAGGPPTLADCVSVQIACYDPAQLRTVYGLAHLIAHHNDGRGQTIVIIDAFGSPTIRTDLRAFDASFGIVGPAFFDIYHPYGAPHYQESSADEQSWATETTLDVEWAHAMAPRAGIDLLEARNDDNPLAFQALESFAYVHHLGNILSQSYGAAEQNYTTSHQGLVALADNEALYEAMSAAGWTMVAASGDSGVANVDEDNGRLYQRATVNYPAASPINTGVGGTSLYASSNGDYGSETAWNQDAIQDGASGGGVSSYYALPSFQERLNPYILRVLAGHRGVPDVSWDADPGTGVLVRCTATPGCQDLQGFPGWELVGGTSAGAPQWVGLVADVSTAVGHPLGEINTFLYRAGRYRQGFRPVTDGNNSYDGITGFRALPGFNLVTGWGTPTTRLEQNMIRYFKAQ